MSARLLVVEDEEHIRRGLVEGLELEGYTVQSATDGVEAKRLIAACEPELILLDVMMPRLSGFDLCRQLRKAGSAVPIILLTAKAQESDKIVGLELGADDYITKPFSFRELCLRVEAVLRRTRGDGPLAVPTQLSLPDREVDLVAYEVRLAEGEPHSLTPKEVELLSYMAARPGEALDRNTLLAEIWGYGYLGTTRTLDQTVARLRKKLEREPATPEVLRTVHGVGYRLVLGTS